MNTTSMNGSKNSQSLTTTATELQSEELTSANVETLENAADLIPWSDIPLPSGLVAPMAIGLTALLAEESPSRLFDRVRHRRKELELTIRCIERWSLNLTLNGFDVSGNTQDAD